MQPLQLWLRLQHWLLPELLQLLKLWFCFFKHFCDFCNSQGCVRSGSFFATLSPATPALSATSPRDKGTGNESLHKELHMQMSFFTFFHPFLSVFHYLSLYSLNFDMQIFVYFMFFSLSLSLSIRFSFSFLISFIFYLCLYLSSISPFHFFCLSLYLFLPLHLSIYLPSSPLYLINVLDRWT